MIPSNENSFNLEFRVFATSLGMTESVCPYRVENGKSQIRKHHQRNDDDREVVERVKCLTFNSSRMVSALKDETDGSCALRHQRDAQRAHQECKLKPEILESNT